MEDLCAAIAALEGRRGSIGDKVVELATTPLRARLAALLRPAGLQRRQVTVLFADVVGSTAMAQGLDAEDTLARLSGALQRMAAIVDPWAGDALWTVRGAPVRSEFLRLPPGFEKMAADDTHGDRRLALEAMGHWSAELRYRRPEHVRRSGTRIAIWNAPAAPLRRRASPCDAEPGTAHEAADGRRCLAGPLHLGSATAGCLRR